MPATFRTVIMLNPEHNYRRYYDLDESDTRFVRRIAKCFDMTIEQFLRAFDYDELPNPFASLRKEQKQVTKKDCQQFQMECDNPKLIRLLDTLAQMDGSATWQEWCVRQIYVALETDIGEIIYSPAGAALCHNSRILDMGFWTDDEREPVKGEDGQWYFPEAKEVAHE